MTSEPPLCVDLDGTLIDGDTLLLSLRGLLRQQPRAILTCLPSLLRGRAAFKGAVARRIVPDPALLPWRPTVVHFVRAQHSAGRRVLLTTAAHARIAQSVASYLGCFDGIVATQDGRNAKGVTKVAAIKRWVGDGPFDYVGDSRADVPVFEASRHGYLVSSNAALKARLLPTGRVTLLDG